jgi:hypothetical protein
MHNNHNCYIKIIIIVITIYIITIFKLIVIIVIDKHYTNCIEWCSICYYDNR